MKLGLIACGGHLPGEIEKSCLQNNIQPVIIGFHERPPLIQADFMVSLGQTGKLLRFLRKNHITHLAVCGYLDRPILSHLRFDWTGVKTALKLLPYFRKGDNALLHKIIRIFEKHGFCVPPISSYASSLLTPHDCLTHIKPDRQDFKDLELGLNLLKTLSPFDIGQACSVGNGLVLCIETLEGTDNMLKKLQDFPGTKRPPLPSGVFIKAAKTTQDMRIDLPTVGLETIKNVHLAGLKGIFCEAEASFLLEKQDCIDYCNAHHLFLCGFITK